jgi:hypothetical protein
MLRRRRGPFFQARGLGGRAGPGASAEKPSAMWGPSRCERDVCASLRSFVIVAGLILAATGIGVWAASRTTNHAKAGAKAVNVEREGVPVGGGLFVMPPVY